MSPVTNPVPSATILLNGTSTLDTGLLELKDTEIKSLTSALHKADFRVAILLRTLEARDEEISRLQHQ